jgi:hypothetical protein
MKKLVLYILLLIASGAHAQDTLPKFTLKNVGANRIVIGWVNNYTNVRQISIQRSFDSLTGFKSILTVADPTTPENGYVDTKAANDRMFYRIYIMLDKGFFTFSETKRPVFDSARRNDFTTRIDKFPARDTVSSPGPYKKVGPNAFVPSLYVYTHRDGYVRISLPDDEKPKKYSVKFFRDDNTFLFELKEIKEKDFRIDKSNFYRAGWFRFELYEDDQLIERHKFYLEKEF